MNSLIDIKSVTKYFEASGGMFRKGQVFAALDDVSLCLERGRSLGLVGESGSGKTTLARIICGVYVPDKGECLFKGENVSGLKNGSYDDYRKNVQMVFQDPHNSLNPKLTVRSAISDGIRAHITTDKKEINERLLYLMDMVGLSKDYLDRYPHEFSGGQRQRISIARALSLEPELIIADEPVSSLDVSVQAQILNLMSSLKEKGVTFILISHSLSAVSFLCEDTAVLRKGKLVEAGVTGDILTRPSSDYTKKLLEASSSKELLTSLK